MIVGVGTDLCENERIRNLFDRYGKRFLNRIFSEEEQSYCMKRKDPVPHLCARFALKEAFIKALGIRRNLALSYYDVGLLGSLPGKKDIFVKGKLKQLFEESRADRIFFSISHAKEYSSAYVILEQLDGK